MVAPCARILSSLSHNIGLGLFYGSELVATIREASDAHINENLNTVFVEGLSTRLPSII